MGPLSRTANLAMTGTVQGSVGGVLVPLDNARLLAPYFMLTAFILTVFGFFINHHINSHAISDIDHEVSDLHPTPTVTLESSKIRWNFRSTMVYQRSKLRCKPGLPRAEVETLARNLLPSAFLNFTSDCMVSLFGSGPDDLDSARRRRVLVL